MNVLMFALGSHGDVHPFVGIGLRLRERGHQVRVVANPHFESLITREGLGFLPIGTDAEYRELATDPGFWKRLEGTRKVLPWVAKSIRPVYEMTVRECASARETIVVSSSLGLGARIAQDQLGIPLVTVHLQPSILISATAPPSLAGIVTPEWFPMWLKRQQVAMVDRACDPLVAPELNAVRREAGLPPISHVMTQYLHSPQRVIGLFPDWFGPPARDWPPQTRLTGFPLYDECGVTRMPDALARFLDEGEPPIAFTPGSAMWSGQRFFAESAKACALMGRRGVLLSRHADHLPRRLPACVIHVPYAPFGALLPRCAAIVHHGGIGTTAQALRAGIPQLVTPFAHDQHDNAARLMKMGVARKIEPLAYRAGGIAARLESMLDHGAIKSRCDEISLRFRGIDPIGATCEWIERLNTSCTAASAPQQQSA